MSAITVDHVCHMGDALSVVNAARVSFGSHIDELKPRDVKLIRFLAENAHMSPFEHCTMTVRVTCPLYIRSQIMRHRTFSYNEISRRYTSKDLEFYVPETFRTQSRSNRQASGEDFPEDSSEELSSMMKESHERALDVYNALLSKGVAREIARGVLPMNTMTEFYMTGNLRNWAHFIKLRDHEDAQPEVQVVAREVKKHCIENFGVAAKVLLEPHVSTVDTPSVLTPVIE